MYRKRIKKGIEWGTETCTRCTLPATVGNKCFRHYILKLAQERNLMQYKWFTARFDLLVSTLAGRFWAIKAGAEPPCKSEELPRRLWKGRSRPSWLHGEQTPPRWGPRGMHQKYRLLSLLVSVDTRAKKEAERAANSSSEADRS